MLTQEEIQKALATLQNSSQIGSQEPIFYIGAVKTLNRERYSGKGRPRDDDYDYDFGILQHTPTQ